MNWFTTTCIWHIAASDSTDAKTETSTEETQKTEEENQADAEQLMKDLTGSYQELCPVILDDQYKQLWLENSKDMMKIKELFSHTYYYAGMEETRGLYEYESDDKDSGEFTYFYIAPDTNDTTYHIELRYDSDLDALGQYDKGTMLTGLAPEFLQSMTRRWLRTVLNFSARRIFLSSKK